MCRETIRRSVVQKFKEEGGKEFEKLESFDELKDKIEHTDKKVREKANALINSLKICDPAVGSGHFLVSALNEMIAIKSDLQILNYLDGSRVKGYKVTIANDELIIINEETDKPFTYILNQKNNPVEEQQQLQETLFHEKQNIIENCLFGVDINPKSVMICRLRLWIELLKNAYYNKQTNYTELETLPNIDINIKCGNSLISRFKLDDDLSEVFRSKKFSHQSYLIAVAAYKNAKDKSEKDELKKFIADIKQQFMATILNKHPYRKELSKKRADLTALDFTDLFGLKKRTETEAEKEKKKLQKEIDELEKKAEEYKNAAIYQNAFEWRFEFPEVLNDNGKYLGFDVTIGNPPYILVQTLNDRSFFQFFKEQYYTATYKIDTYQLFYELGFKILNKSGILSFISPNSFLKNKFSKNLRELLISKHSIYEITNFFVQVFEDASVDTLIPIADNKYSTENILHYKDYRASNSEIQLISYTSKSQKIFSVGEYVMDFDITEDSNIIIKKLEKKSIPLGKIGGTYFGIQTHDRNIHVSKIKNNEHFLPVIDGTNVNRYFLIPSNEYVNYVPQAIHSRGDLKIYSKERIVVRQIGKFPEGVIIPSMMLTLNTIYNIFINNTAYDLRYVLSILNSSVTKFFWIQKFFDTKSNIP